MPNLRLDLIVRRYLYDDGYDHRDQWSWRLWSGSRVVSTSGSQLYSRRIDCARGAEVGAGLMFVADAARGVGRGAVRNDLRGHQVVEVRIIDERAS